jgi:histidine triad (HIT) family protein
MFYGFMQINQNYTKYLSDQKLNILMNDIFCNRNKILGSVLYESNNFYVLVGLGLITPGHVMLIPKKHYNALAELPNQILNEYEKTKNLVINKISNAFSKPYLTEHGNCRQSVPHAHMHFIPKVGDGYEIKSIREELINPSNLPFVKGNFSNLQKTYNEDGGYISIEDDQLYIFRAKKFSFEEQNRIVYRKFFTRNGFSKINRWQEMSNENKLYDAKNREITKRLLKF